MRLILHPGVWISSASLCITGGIAMTSATDITQVATYRLGELAVALGVLLFIWGIKWDGRHWWARRPSMANNMTAYELSHYLTDQSDWGWRVRTYKVQSPEFLRDLASTIKLNGPMSVPGEFHRVAQVDSNNLRVSGTKIGALEPESIPPVFWTENGLSLESTFIPAVSETAPMRTGSATIYRNVRINRADVERLWPRRNIIKRWLTRREQREWRKLLGSLPEAPIQAGATDEATSEVWTAQDEANLQQRKREEEERGYSDEWAWRAAKSEALAKVERDKSLSEALAYHVEGQWGREYFESVKAGRSPDGAPLTQAVQLAYDGELTIWGKRTEAGVYEIIPKEFWTDHHVNGFSLWRRMPVTVPNSGAASDTRYFDLMVSRTQFERVMPFEREKAAD